MAIIKCKMCGGDLEITEGVTVAECEYCGTKQTVPSADSEKKTSLFLRANKLRFDCDFDRAANIYDSIITDFPAEPEAYWGLLLCKYGIEYVDDPATGKKVPACHRSSYESLLEDENLEKVMEYADAVARRVYREEAKAIEGIRKGILEVSGKEPPYDIFICYKETDESGERTVDSVLAQDGLPYQMAVFAFESLLEAKQWALDTQRGRRNLDKWELGKIALKLKPEIEAKARENMSAGGGDQKYLG